VNYRVRHSYQAKPNQIQEGLPSAHQDHGEQHQKNRKTNQIHHNDSLVYFEHLELLLN
jgi:hypothetical protein